MGTSTIRCLCFLVLPGDYTSRPRVFAVKFVYQGGYVPWQRLSRGESAASQHLCCNWVFAPALLLTLLADFRGLRGENRANTNYQITGTATRKQHGSFGEGEGVRTAMQGAVQYARSMVILLLLRPLFMYAADKITLLLSCFWFIYMGPERDETLQAIKNQHGRTKKTSHQSAFGELSTDIII